MATSDCDNCATTLSNYEKWRLYTDGLISPDNFIDFGWYFLISAALQRRIWTGPDHQRLYPNIYVIPVAEPGIGKGLVIKQVAELLKFHKLPDPKSNGHNKAVTEIDRQMMEEVAESDYKLAQGVTDENDRKKTIRNKNFDKPYLFPIAADSTTYEALVKAVSQSIRRINYYDINSTTGNKELRVYTHSSISFCLEEVSSLIRRRTEDVIHFLIQTYDCGDYIYDTKTQGKDKIKKCCVSFFGGTTPGFLQSTFDDRLLTEGFSSRTFFIFAASNRKTALWVPDLTKEQKSAYVDIQLHLEKLSHLYGRVRVDQNSLQELENWWQASQARKVNTSPKLLPYYSRKNIHFQKLAMAIHFGESTEMEIPLKTYQRAIEVLEREEKNMHLALGVDRTNPLSAPAERVWKNLTANGKKSRKELLLDHWEELPNGPDSLDEIITHLIMSGKVRDFTENMIDGTNKIYFDAIRKR